MTDVDLTCLDEASAGALARQLLAEWDRTEAAMADLHRRGSGLRKMLAGLVQMFPSLESALDLRDLRYADDDRQSVPRGADAVRRILLAHREVWLTVTEVTDFLAAKGWAPESQNTANAVRTALERLVASGAAEKRRLSDGVVYSAAG